MIANVLSGSCTASIRPSLPGAGFRWSEWASHQLCRIHTRPARPITSNLGRVEPSWRAPCATTGGGVGRPLRSAPDLAAAAAGSAGSHGGAGPLVAVRDRMWRRGVLEAGRTRTWRCGVAGGGAGLFVALRTARGGVGGWAGVGVEPLAVRGCCGGAGLLVALRTARGGVGRWRRKWPSGRWWRGVAGGGNGPGRAGGGAGSLVAAQDCLGGGRHGPHLLAPGRSGGRRYGAPSQAVTTGARLADPQRPRLRGIHLGHCRGGRLCVHGRRRVGHPSAKSEGQSARPGCTRGRGFLAARPALAGAPAAGDPPIWPGRARGLARACPQRPARPPARPAACLPARPPACPPGRLPACPASPPCRPEGGTGMASRSAATKKSLPTHKSVLNGMRAGCRAHRRQRCNLHNRYRTAAMVRAVPKGSRHTRVPASARCHGGRRGRCGATPLGPSAMDLAAVRVRLRCALRAAL